MPAWTPNEALYGPGGGDYVDDLGTSTPDPWGVLAPQPIPAGVEEFVGQIRPPTPTPVAPAPHAAPPVPLTRAEDLTAMIEAPVPQPGLADRAAPVAPPVPRPGSADMQPAMIPQTETSSERSTQTSGVDAAGAKRIEAAGANAQAAAGAAGQAQIDLNTATAGVEQQQSRAAYGRGVNTYFEQLGQLQVQQAIERDTTGRLEAAAQFKPDRTQLFQGDRGALFGISAAISAMAGGWLMGQGLTGGKNPYLDTVLRMIDDNANDQIAQNSSVVQELTRRLGDAQAAKKELKARMLGAVNDTVEAQSRFEKSELVQKGSASIMAQVQAEQAKTQLDVAKLVAKNVTNTHSSHSQTKMVANPAALGGLDVTDSKVIARMDKVGALETLLNDAMSLSASGDLQAYTGLVDEAVGSVARSLQARTPAQKKVEDFKASLQLINRADWASEPNGQQIQQQLSSIGIPENDSEIPVAIERLRNILNQVDPGGRFRQARRAVGDRPRATETQRIPVVR
jgi:hypothetical protein